MQLVNVTSSITQNKSPTHSLSYFWPLLRWLLSICFFPFRVCFFSVVVHVYVDVFVLAVGCFSGHVALYR